MINRCLCLFSGLILTVFVLILTLFPGVSAVLAADEKGVDVVKELSADQVGDDASVLLARINSRSERAKDYARAIRRANDEDRQVLQLLLAQLQDLIMADVHQLADSLLALEKKDEQPELRQQVVTALEQATPRLWYLIDQLRRQIDDVRVRRTKAEAIEWPAIENEVAKLTARLDKWIVMGLTHLIKMKKVGVDTAKARETLVELLKDRAEELYGRILLASDRIDELETRRKEVPDDDAAAKMLVAAAKNLETNAASMDTILEIMDDLELDTKMYRAHLVEVTRDLSSGLTDTSVAISLVGRYSERLTDWLVEKGPKVLLKFLLFCGIIILFNFIRRLVHKGLEKALNKNKLNLTELARRMIVSTAANLVMLFGLLIALSQLGISLGPLLAGLGVAGFIVGFALQDSLSNFASGVMILIYRPYDVGDLIEVSGAFGKVQKMNIVSTTISTVDNQMIVVPNNKIWGDVIKNITAQELRRVDMVFGISYSDDIDKAEAILNDILKQHDKILDEPEPIVRLHTLNDSSVDFVVRPWTRVTDYWDVYWDVTKTVKKRFDSEGVSIPFPQRDVHVYNTA